MIACTCECHDVLNWPCGGCYSPAEWCGWNAAPVDPAIDTECEGCS